MGKLQLTERKVLGALLSLANDEGMVKVTMPVLAQKMGYKTHGGAITFAIRILEMNNYIVVEQKGVKGRINTPYQIKVLVA